MGEGNKKKCERTGDAHNRQKSRIAVAALSHAGMKRRRGDLSIVPPSA